MDQLRSKFLIGFIGFMLALIAIIFNIRALALIDVGIVAIFLGFWNRKSIPGILFYLILGVAGLAIFLGIFSFWVKLW